MNDNIDNFDLQVREMLQDASVKAPMGVWWAVRRRISPAGAAPFYAVALSFAAAICAGVFFAGHFWRTGTVSEPLLSQVTYSTAYDAVVPEPAASCEINVMPAPGHTVLPVTGAATADAISIVIAPEEQNCGQDNVNPAGTTGNSSAANVSDRHPDPFAEIQRQEMLASLGKRRPSLTVSGNLSSNSEFSAASSFFGAEGEGSGALVKTGLESFGIPLQLGAGIRIPLTRKLSLGTGLSYTFLSSAFDARYMGNSGSVRHNMSYLGIPVNLIYSLVQLENINVYAHAGGSAEYCISNKYRFWGSPESTVIKEPVKGLMFSAGAGLGMEFKLTGSIGVYFDPSFRYYFHCDHPTSIRTEKPQTFNFEAGVRFSL